MNNTTEPVLLEASTAGRRIRASLARRHRQERLFQWLGIGAVALGLGFVLLLLVSVIAKGYSGFLQTHIRLSIDLSEEMLLDGAPVTEENLRNGDYRRAVRSAMQDLFPDVSGRRDRRELQRLVSNGAEFMLRDQVLADPELVGRQIDLWLPADDDVDMFAKGRARSNPGDSVPSRLSEQQRAWIAELERSDRLDIRFNWAFFSHGDSRDPEMAGIWGAAVGSFLTLLVTLVLSFPLGVATAIYLEEFAPRNRWTDLVEVNINNLAAVPSIIFGLLGLAVFINFFGMPRSAPLVGGLVLTLMTLPTIIIASRAALRSVPPSIREAALGMGASRTQTVFHHVLPLAMPGMLTGTIIGMAQALGETAPLLMIGMVAFIVDVPQSLTDPSTTLPVQIYLWADSPERAFVERTSAAIMVLLGVLAMMNLAAVLLRRKLERRW